MAGAPSQEQEQEAGSEEQSSPDASQALPVEYGHATQQPSLLYCNTVPRKQRSTWLLFCNPFKTIVSITSSVVIMTCLIVQHVWGSWELSLHLN